MKSSVLYENGSHRWLVIGRDADKRDDVIDTNQYVIVTDTGAMLLDPGGIEIFPRMLSELTRYVSTEDIKVIFSSHQDPDVISSLGMWLDLCPDAKVSCSWLWSGFIAHFCMTAELTTDPIPDEGAPIAIGNTSNRVQAIPAHYCHSSGNFSIFDPRAEILFTGDIGAALLPADHTGLFVEDFDAHVQYMEGFHRRWMPANKPLRAWVARARALNPSMICPQHGSIFAGDDVKRFLDWLEALDVESCDPMALPSTDEEAEAA